MALFVRYLLGRLWAYGHQTRQGGWVQARKTPRENKILKLQAVAMEMTKLSHSSGIGPMVVNFSWSQRTPP